MPISYLAFDLDDTLYPPDNGLWDELAARIVYFMIQEVGVDPSQVDELRRRYYRTYGTTLRGLMTEYPGVDAEAYLAYVHDIDLGRWIGPNPALEAMLASLRQPKAIFTNADAAHCQRVLTRLGVARHFDTIVDIRAMEFENKPRPAAYRALLRLIARPAAECVLVEDSLRNLRPAHAIGMTTILVGDGNSSDPAADYRVQTILEAGDVIRQLADRPGSRPPS